MGIDKSIDGGRNITLDYFKIFLSFLVISIHLDPLFTNELHLLGAGLSQGIAHIAVPCFFMINGYFLFDKIGHYQKIKKLLNRLVIVYIVWSIIYLPFWINAGYGKTVSVLFLLLGYAHLWYIAALIVGVVILYGLLRCKVKPGYLLILSLALYIAGIYFNHSEVLRQQISSTVVLDFISRNVLTVGFPFIFLGYYVKMNIEKCLRFNTKAMIGFIVLGVSFLLIRTFVRDVEDFSLWGSSLLNIPALIFVCPSLFILVLKYSKYEAGHDRFVGDLSSGIYYSHLICIFLVGVLTNAMNIYKFPLVILLSMLMSISLMSLNKRIKIFL